MSVGVPAACPRLAPALGLAGANSGSVVVLCGYHVVNNFKSGAGHVDSGGKGGPFVGNDSPQGHSLVNT